MCAISRQHITFTDATQEERLVDMYVPISQVFYSAFMSWGAFQEVTKAVRMGGVPLSPNMD